jgi:adenosylcobinamide-GDP ribazoletransferase
MSSGEFAVAALTAALPVVAVLALRWLPPVALLAGLIAAAIATFWLARMFARRIGGYTGDCLGAVQQVTEVMFYLCALACLPR